MRARSLSPQPPRAPEERARRSGRSPQRRERSPETEKSSRKGKRLLQRHDPIPSSKQESTSRWVSSLGRQAAHNHAPAHTTVPPVGPDNMPAVAVPQVAHPPNVMWPPLHYPVSFHNGPPSSGFPSAAPVAIPVMVPVGPFPAPQAPPPPQPARNQSSQDRLDSHEVHRVSQTQLVSLIRQSF